MEQAGAMLVGLCGMSGAGKGYIAEIFSSFGIPSIDTDAVYRDLTAPSDPVSECMKELVSRFGEGIRNSDNSLNRSALREIVFTGDREALADLNRISHRLILEETRRRAGALYKEGYKVILIDAPLLFESGFDKECAKNICVTAPYEKLVKRIMKRDGITAEEAERRLSNQTSQCETASRCDYIIVNDFPKRKLRSDVKKIAAELKKTASEDANNRKV